MICRKSWFSYCFETSSIMTLTLGGIMPTLNWISFWFKYHFHSIQYSSFSCWFGFVGFFFQGFFLMQQKTLKQLFLFMELQWYNRFKNLYSSMEKFSVKGHQNSQLQHSFILSWSPYLHIRCHIYAELILVVVMYQEVPDGILHYYSFETYWYCDWLHMEEMGK